MDVKDIIICVANFLGTLTAHMDQRKWTPATVLALIADNIQAGNQQMIDALIQDGGGNA